MQAFASASAAAPTTKTSGLSAEAKKRAKAAVLGGLVADAATMPLHWIYDVSTWNLYKDFCYRMLFARWECDI